MELSVAGLCAEQTSLDQWAVPGKRESGLGASSGTATLALPKHYFQVASIASRSVIRGVRCDQVPQRLWDVRVSADLSGAICHVGVRCLAVFIYTHGMSSALSALGVS